MEGSVLGTLTVLSHCITMNLSHVCSAILILQIKKKSWYNTQGHITTPLDLNLNLPEYRVQSLFSIVATML